jgi:hypothetical protein
MAAGRCEGCGQTGSARKLAAHITQCGQWLGLYAQDPRLALSPEESRLRWQEGGRAESRAEHLLAVTSDIADRRGLAAARFSPPHPLDD